MLAVVSSSSYDTDLHCARLMFSKYNGCHLRDGCVDLHLVCLQIKDCSIPNEVASMLYKFLSLHHEEENALFFSAKGPSHRLSLVDLICVLYRIGP